MDRRVFFGSAAAVCGSLVFSRKTESKDEQIGLTNEEMAEIILNHPLTVFLHGDMKHFGRVREKAGKWRTGGKFIDCDCIVGQGSRTKVVNGCRVEVHCREMVYNLHPRGLINRDPLSLVKWRQRFDSEEWFDISQPELKLIRCMGRDMHSTKYPRVICRNFARVGHRWLEV